LTIALTLAVSASGAADELKAGENFPGDYFETEALMRLGK
jgi:hypothetical protein